MKGKTIVVTGATSGIGRAMADKFAMDGARVIAVGRNQIVLNEMRGGIPFRMRQIWQS